MTEKIFINPITETLKKSITRFDESNINTFNLPTLEYLIDKGFEICYNNRIHLKLYITDNDAFVTSSNLTTGGFEKNVELTVKVDNENFENCQGIFNDLWTESKQENFKVGSLNIQQLLDLIFNSKEDYTNRLNLAYSANKSRNQLKDKLKNNDFDLSLFYVPEGHPKRRENLFYNFVYGSESKLAGTGLREAQFKDVFEHPEFKNIISFYLKVLDYNLGISKTIKPFSIFVMDCSILIFRNIQLHFQYDLHHFSIQNILFRFSNLIIYKKSAKL